MAGYASVEQVAAGFRTIAEAEKPKCEALIEEAAIIIDHYNKDATADVKRLVTCHMVRRAMGDGDDGTATFPMGATQGSMSALGYAQSWSMGSGSNGELYLAKLDKDLLGRANKIGSYSPVEDLS